MELGLLGSVEVWRDGQPLNGGHARQRAVLAVLMLDLDHVVPVEALIDRVWGEGPPRSVRNTLYGYVSRLRSAIGVAADLGVTLSRRPGGYLLHAEGEQLDLYRFRLLTEEAANCGDTRRKVELLRRALGLWRGPALSGVQSRWLDAMRDTLEAGRLAALADLSDVRLRRGEHCTLVRELAEQAVARPGDERLIGQLMLALYRSGRQADALRWFEQTRRHLVTELGVDPGFSLQALHQRILRADPELTLAESISVPPESVGGPSARECPANSADEGSLVAVPRQLPASAGYFTGRRGEMDLIVGLTGLSRQPEAFGTVMISAIDGMAGIGKTALAVHAAHHLAGNYPDGQLFIDLHGCTKGYPPRDPGQALATLLRALGVPPQKIPEDTDARAALYRQRLAGTRTLVLLDNALDEAQVHPLLPAEPGCLVLITSRRRLKGLHDAHAVALDVLTEADAITLLRTISTPSPAAADADLAEVARLCGRLPLALRIAGALLRHRSTWTPAHLIGMLRDEHQRLTALADGHHDLRALFDLSCDRLSQQERRMFLLLALVPGHEIDTFAAAALLDADPATALGLLGNLVDHNLLTEHAPGRYRLHDLLRAHAEQLADGDARMDRDRALDRLMAYYAHTARRASTLIARCPRPVLDSSPACAPALAEAEEARAWLRAERENLLAACSRARSDGLDGHLVALAAGLAEILRTDGSLALALDLHRAAVDVAERHGWAAACAAALTDLANVQILTDDLIGAIDAASRALEIFRETGNRVGEACALHDLARARFLTGDFVGTADAASGALEIFRETGNRVGEACALTAIGQVRFITGDFAQATDAAAQVLKIYLAAGNRVGEACALAEMGRARSSAGDLAGAADAASRALEISRDVGDRFGEACVLIEIGQVRFITGDLPGAMDAAAGALRTFRAIGIRHGEARALTDLGRMRLAKGDLPGAGDSISRALQIYRTIGNRSDEGCALNHYAAVAATTGDLPRALALYRQALTIHREFNKPGDEAIALEGIGEYHLATGQIQTGVTHLNQALEIYDRLGMKLDIERMRARVADLSESSNACPETRSDTEG